MKILHVASHWGMYRGGAVQLTRIAIEQQKRGHEVSVAFSDKYLKNPLQRYRDINSWKFLEKYGVKSLPVRYRGAFGHKRFLKLFLKERFDIIHVHRNEALLKTTKALSGYDVPIVAQRGTISKPNKPHLIKAFRSNNVKAIIAVAEAVKNSMVETIGADKKDIIHSIYGSVDVDLFSPKRPDLDILRELNLPQKAKIIGSLSSYRKSKKIENLLYSLEHLLKEDKHIYGIFLGSDLHKTIIPLSKQLGIEKNCRFLGYRADIRPYLSIMNVSVVAASGQEGLSGVLRESLAMEIPVISTDCAGNNEIVDDKKTGLLIPVDQLDELTDAIRWSFENHLESKEMAKNGRKWILENCTPKVQAQQLDKIYNKMTPPQ